MYGHENWLVRTFCTFMNFVWLDHKKRNLDFNIEVCFFSPTCTIVSSAIAD